MNSDSLRAKDIYYYYPYWFGGRKSTCEVKAGALPPPFKLGKSLRLRRKLNV